MPGPSVFPSGGPGVSGDFWGSQEGCQGPSRPSGRNRGLPLRRRRTYIHIYIYIYIYIVVSFAKVLESGLNLTFSASNVDECHFHNEQMWSVKSAWRFCIKHSPCQPKYYLVP